MNDSVDQNDTPDSNAAQRLPISRSSTPAKKHRTKKQIAIALLRRAQGASRAELEKTLGWQPHSIRGFLSSTAAQIAAFDLVSRKTKSGQRRYRLVAKEAA